MSYKRRTTNFAAASAISTPSGVRIRGRLADRDDTVATHEHGHIGLRCAAGGVDDGGVNQREPPVLGPSVDCGDDDR